MSSVGAITGSPEPGESMLCVEGITCRASATASRDSGTWTALWAPGRAAVEGGGAVEQHRARRDDFVEDVPNLGAGAVDDALGALDVVGHAVGDELVHDEGLEELQRHSLGQAALMQLQLRADDDDGATG